MLNWVNIIDIRRCERDLPILIDEGIGGQRLELLGCELGIIRFAFWDHRNIHGSSSRIFPRRATVDDGV